MVAALVSVLMPVYNTKVEYLKEAIDSILGQTYDNFELLILNDCSTDDRVEKTVLSYNDRRIKYHKNEKNLGISGSRNKLVDLASGEYLAVMDHDDISLPSRFEKEVELLDNKKDVGVVSCWHKLVGCSKIKKLPIDNEEIEKQLLFKCCILHPASMIRKSVLLENKIRYENEFTPAEDYALWCRLIGKTKFANIPSVLFEYRKYGTNTTAKQKNKMVANTCRIHEFVRHDNSQIWDTVKHRISEITCLKLFGFLPLIYIVKRNNKTKFYLFYKILLFSTKSRTVYIS
jgi:glycosyltransferase involved in cell wall biosynthesis